MLSFSLNLKKIVWLFHFTYVYLITDKTFTGIIIMLKIKSFLIGFLLIFFAEQAYTCTTTIISGRFTKDGRPIIFKHRDSSFEQNKLMFFDDGKYEYIGLVNSVDEYGSEVWGGCNSTGFAIMNSASYNLKPDHDLTRLADQEGKVMKLALQNCETLEDFEALLDSLPKPLGVEANFGVIDAQGGCAYYECNNYEYRKIDANDPKIAPFGYIIRTNYSFTGSRNDGYGYIRYLNAENLMYQAEAEDNLTCKFLLQDVSRSLKHSLTGVDLTKSEVEKNLNKFVHLQDYIVRNSSVSTILIQGVKEGESPDLATIWTVLGFPLTSVAVPTWVKAGDNLPECVRADKTGNAPLCEYSLQLKDKCFPINRGSGYKYMNLPFVYNEDGTGVMQKIRPLENEIMKKTDERMAKWREHKHVPKQEALDFYESINLSVMSFYKNLLTE